MLSYNHLTGLDANDIHKKTYANTVCCEIKIKSLSIAIIWQILSQ